MDPIDIRKRMVNGLLAGYLVFVFAISAYTLVQGASWLRVPFFGKFLEPSLIFGRLPHTSPDLLPSQTEGLSGQQLIAIQNNPLTKQADLGEFLQSNSAGDQLTLTLRSDTGDIITVTQTLRSFELKNQLLYFYFPALIGWLFFLAALLSFKNWLINQGGASSVIFLGAMALVLATTFDVVTTHILYPLWVSSIALAGAAFLHYAASQFHGSKLYNQMIGFLYFLSLAIAFLTWVTPYGLAAPTLLLSYLRFVLIWSSLTFWIGMALLLFALIKARGQNPQLQNVLSFSSFVLAFMPLQIWLLMSFFLPNLLFSWWLFPSLIILPVVYLIYDLQINTERPQLITARLFMYGLLLVFITVGFAFLVTGFGVIVLGEIQSNNLFLNGFVIFIIALLVLPVKSYLDQQLQRNKPVVGRNYEGKLSVFNSDLSHLSSIDDIANLLRLDIQGTVQAQIIHVFLWNPKENGYVATGGGLNPTSDIYFEALSPLPVFLDKTTSNLYFSNIDQLPSGLRGEKDRIRLLAARLMIPIHGQNSLLGWVAMSNRLDGEVYEQSELDYLNALVMQASVAIERSLVINSLERRITELDILTRAAQGVSYTLELDDLYEFIFNSMQQVQSADFFYILLHENNAKVLDQVFWVENGDRKKHRENQSIPAEKSLEMQVIGSGKARFIRTYQQESEGFYTDPARTKIESALLIPLNTGANTLGVMVFGSENEIVATSDERISLLQALADQFAAALVKVRLLNESELRGKQLANLNRLTQQLTSTLSVIPLYRIILEISMEILHCRSGALLTIDSLTGEVEYRVCLGEYSKQLEGTRIPSGSGISAKSIATKRAEIAHQFDDGHTSVSQTNQENPKIQSILSIPLLKNNETIGVIELVERQDGSPFSANDQEIMTAFAAQAAIALENARLYSNTDLALTNRIEELSIMQRIDRELNSTLNLVRALDITLHWAIRQSHANAGIIGQVYPEGIRLEVYEGLETRFLEKLLGKYLEIGFMEVGAAFEKGQPVQKQLEDGEQRLHPEARLQVIIPITRKEQRLAFFLLEFFNPEFLDEQSMEFLVRLSEHASFALVNSQLYTQVQSASIAKSDFVNLVAHELKNPMTSIKGYTELLAGGAVGPINEAQGNFLGTIRSNIDRMNTLISDLNDLSKIEAGRLRLEFTAVNLSEVMSQVVQSNRRMLADKKQELVVEIPNNLPDLWIDAMRLDQILTNLLSNAIKYSSDEAMIRVGAEADTTHLSSENGIQWVHFWIGDEGIGIKEDDQLKIFQKFFRSEDPKTREAPGTGLGLNITRSMVELQGGAIWFESEFRKGTTFHLRLPVSREK